jgi:hypothetical protein
VHKYIMINNCNLVVRTIIISTQEVGSFILEMFGIILFEIIAFPF